MILDLIQDETDYLSNQLITYLGNKRKLLGFIGDELDRIIADLKVDRLTMLDGFAGSGVVSRFFKKSSRVLHSNDLETYAKIIGTCHLTNQSDVPAGLHDAINQLNQQKLRKDLGRGLIEDLYAPKDDYAIEADERVFYTNRNAKIIDNIRRSIDEYSADLKPFLLAALLQKASVHTNTSGVFKGFYKDATTGRGQFGGTAQNALERITKDIELEVPLFSLHDCEWHMHQQDTNELVKSITVDVAYFDPPYNQHPYGSNYFMLNVIADYQRPDDISKVSGIPKDWNKSSYNKKTAAQQSFDQLIRDTQAKYILVSYNDEGIIPADELMAIFQTHGDVELREKSYPTFRGSRNLQYRSKSIREYLYVIKKSGVNS